MIAVEEKLDTNIDVEAIAKHTLIGKGFSFNDSGNAKRLVALFGDQIRYCPQSKHWLIWSGIRWKPDEKMQIENFAKQTARAIGFEAANTNEAERKAKLLRWASSSGHGNRIREMINLAQSEPGIAIIQRELDSNPYLLNVENGTLNLKTGILLEHNKDDVITKLAPVRFDPEAKCPRFDRFLQEVTNKDEELIAFMRRCFGYALTGDVSEQVFFMLHGEGENGKSTILGIFEDLMGDYAKRMRVHG